jgi:Tol biopolymer transport system component
MRFEHVLAGAVGSARLLRVGIRFASPMRTALLTAALVTLLVAVLFGVGASRAGVQERAGTIAFIRLAPGPAFGGRLFVVHADGSGLRGLTPPSTRVYSYAWSPDGRLIAYNDSEGSLWLVRPGGTGRRLLSPAARRTALSLSWSPDGKEIAIVSPVPNVGMHGRIHHTSIFLVPVGGGDPRQLAVGDVDGVGWSPRGDEIAYDGNGGIFVIRLDGTGRRQISLGGGVTWSADGEKLAFGIALHLRNGHTDRYRAFAVVDADGSGYHVVTTHAYNEPGVAWSPHGRRILYVRADGKGIYVIGADGRNNHRVTPDSPPGAGWGALAWSPDGGSIVYDTGGTDNTDLYVIGADGRGKFRLTSTPDTDIAPSWVAR